MRVLRPNFPDSWALDRIGEELSDGDVVVVLSRKEVRALLKWLDAEDEMVAEIRKQLKGDKAT